MVKAMRTAESRPGKELRKLVRIVRILTKVIAWTLPILFAYLKLNELDKNISFDDLIKRVANVTAPDFLWKSALTLYFISWVYGANADIDEQEQVYLTAPNQGRLPVAGIGFILMIAVVFLILSRVQHYWEFAIVLTSFWVLNILAWRYLLKKIVMPSLRASYTLYRAGYEYLKIEKLKVVESYIAGHWQSWRFAAGGIVIFCMIILSFTRYQHDVASSLPTPLQDQFKPEFIPAVTILFFVGFMELWIWAMRLRTKMALSYLDYLSDHYEFEPIRGKSKSR